MSMQRYAAGVEYFGAPFLGWQRQSHGPTVQEGIEAALSRIADHQVEAQCAGRTDAGVHAALQVMHFDSTAPRSPRAWMLGANTLLPDAISILWVQPVSADFHARYSATRRTYHYLILNRASRPGLMRDRVTWECRPLAEARMMAAAQPLLGEHDFAAYRAVACQARTSIRTVYRLDIRRSGAWLVIEVEANAFLHHMVRNIAGVLMEIGRGRQPVEWAAEVLHSRDRSRGGVTAPAGGLYLAGVHYPEQYGLPSTGTSLPPLDRSQTTTLADFGEP